MRAGERAKRRARGLAAWGGALAAYQYQYHAHADAALHAQPRDMLPPTKLWLLVEADADVAAQADRSAWVVKPGFRVNAVRVHHPPARPAPQIGVAMAAWAQAGSRL